MAGSQPRKNGVTHLIGELHFRCDGGSSQEYGKTRIDHEILLMKEYKVQRSRRKR